MKIKSKATKRQQLFLSNIFHLLVQHSSVILMSILERDDWDLQYYIPDLLRIFSIYCEWCVQIDLKNMNCIFIKKENSLRSVILNCSFKDVFTLSSFANKVNCSLLFLIVQSHQLPAKSIMGFKMLSRFLTT